MVEPQENLNDSERTIISYLADGLVLEPSNYKAFLAIAREEGIRQPLQMVLDVLEDKFKIYFGKDSMDTRLVEDKIYDLGQSILQQRDPLSYAGEALLGSLDHYTYIDKKYPPRKRK